MAGSALALALVALTSTIANADCVTATDRVDARCYPDLQHATNAAIAQGLPLWLPAQTYILDSELIIDYAPMAGTGFQIISDGAVIDATGMRQRAITITCSGGTPDAPKGCFYFHLQGTLFVNANTAMAAVRVGNNDYSDAHNSIKIDHLIVNNRSTVGWGVRLNYVLNSDIFVVTDTAGAAGLVLTQTQFSRISGAASATRGTALSIQDGYTFANTFQALDLEVAATCLSITSPYANRNTFVSPYFNCTTPVVATAGVQNVLLNASYGASAPPNPSTLTGVVSIP